MKKYKDKNGVSIKSGDFLVYVNGLKLNILEILQVRKFRNTKELWAENIIHTGTGQLSFMFKETMKISKEQVMAIKGVSDDKG